MLDKLNIQAYVIKIRNVSFMVYLRHYFIGNNETFFFFWNISDVENFRDLIWGNKVNLKVKSQSSFESFVGTIQKDTETGRSTLRANKTWQIVLIN